MYFGQRNLEWVYLKNSPASILLRTAPGHFAYNVAAAVHFARAGQAWAFIRGKGAAFAALPVMLRKRAAVQRARRVNAGAIWRVLEPRWFGLKMREKRFDEGVARVRS